MAALPQKNLLCVSWIPRAFASKSIRRKAEKFFARVQSVSSPRDAGRQGGGLTDYDPLKKF
jgi:hypothetical protein